MVKPAASKAKRHGDREQRQSTISEREREATKLAKSRFVARTERLRADVEKTAKGLTTKAAEGVEHETFALRLADAMGTTSSAFTDATLSNIATVLASCSHGGVSSKDVSAALAVLDGMKPENEVEAMLLTQMWATNESAMRALSMIGKSEWINQTALFGNLAVKLLRTYASQVEALAKLRRKGEQTVKVVHVYPGGQAMIADTITAGGGADERPSKQSHAPAASASGSTPLLGEDASGFELPIAGSARPKAVPHARGYEPGGA